MTTPTILCKMQVQEITEHAGYSAKTITLRCMYDTNIPEDKRFYDATPNGEMKVDVNNPIAIESLQLGQYFYLDLLPTTE